MRRSSSLLGPCPRAYIPIWVCVYLGALVVDRIALEVALDELLLLGEQLRHLVLGLARAVQLGGGALDLRGGVGRGRVVRARRGRGAAVGGRGLLRLGRLVAAALAPTPAAAATLREVAQQLARQRAGLARHPCARPAQHLLGLGRVPDRGRQQRSRQPPVLLARGVDEPAGGGRLGAAPRIDEQGNQPP